MPRYVINYPEKVKQVIAMLCYMDRDHIHHGI